MAENIHSDGTGAHTTDPEQVDVGLAHPSLEYHTEDALSIRLQPYWYDDEDPQVGLTVHVGAVEIDAALTPEEAEELAGALQDAAERAQEGANV